MVEHSITPSVVIGVTFLLLSLTQVFANDIKFVVFFMGIAIINFMIALH